VLAGLLLPLIAGLCGARAEEPARPQRELVFLLDTSGSMTSRTGDFPDYDAALATARGKAERVLAEYVDDPTVVVSLYHFGDIRRGASGEWEPNLRPVVEKVDARAATAAFDGFFLSAKDVDGTSNYRDPWTYVAATVHEIVNARYSLKDSCAAPVARDDTPQLSLFVLTDQGDDGNGGGESAPERAGHPQDREGRFAWRAENERRKSWLARQDLANTLSFTHWDVGHDSVDIASAERPVYRVQWVSKQKGSYNLRDPRVGTEQVLDDLEPRIRLVPEGAAPTQRWREAHPELFCAPREAPIAATVAGDAPIDIVADWRTLDGARTPARLDGVRLAWDARPLRGAGYALATQRLDLVGRLKVFLPPHGVGSHVAANSASIHALRFDRDALCEALQDAYPSSTFRLPPDTSSTADGCAVPPAPAGGFDLGPVAQVTLTDREVVNTYEFWVSADGTTPDTGVALGVDRWWKATGGDTRTFRLTPRGSVPGGWTAYGNVAVLDGDRALESYLDVAAFDGESGAGAVPDDQGATLALAMPGLSQRWWTLGGDFPNGEDARTLRARVCFDVRVPDPKVPEIVLTCADCSVFEPVEGAGTCLYVPIEVEGQPFWAWWRIAAATALTLAALWAAFRWFTRPRFPVAFTVGGLKVRAAAEAWRRDPGLLRAQLSAVFLDGNAGLVVYMDIGQQGVVRRVSATPTGTYCLALRARPGSPLAWARIPEGTRLAVPGTGEFVSCTARPMKPDDEASFIFFDDARIGVRRGDQVQELVEVLPRGPQS
jgi:hypothetical protein